MWILTPRYLKEARNYRHGLKRLINYRRDVLPQEDLHALGQLKSQLDGAIKARDREGCARLCAKIEKQIGRVAPPHRNAAWRENIEVLFVAIVIAAGVRAFLLQPFRIPTGSMQPTLYGVVGQKTNQPPPNLLQRAFDFVVLGRVHLNLVADRDVTVMGLRERTHFNFFTFTEIICDRASYSVFSPADPLVKAFGVRPGKSYKAGQPIAVGHMDSGDQVFVDKMWYHFVQPARGDVFVFRTTGIRAIEATLPPGVDSQHYIKRLAGLPGDELRIESPHLFINGKPAQEKPFRHVMSLQNGYGGYANIRSFPHLRTPSSKFVVPQGQYFALGDNSYHSSDSRFFGGVYRRNLTGRGLFVYWPFSKRWGFIR